MVVNVYVSVHHVTCGAIFSANLNPYFSSI